MKVVELLNKAKILNKSIEWWEKKITNLIKKKKDLNKLELTELKMLIKRADLEIKNIDDWLEEKELCQRKKINVT